MELGGFGFTFPTAARRSGTPPGLRLGTTYIAPMFVSVLETSRPSLDNLCA